MRKIIILLLVASFVFHHHISIGIVMVSQLIYDSLTFAPEYLMTAYTILVWLVVCAYRIFSIAHLVYSGDTPHNVIVVVRAITFIVGIFDLMHTLEVQSLIIKN